MTITHIDNVEIDHIVRANIILLLKLVYCNYFMITRTNDRIVANKIWFRMVFATFFIFYFIICLKHNCKLWTLFF